MRIIRKGVFETNSSSCHSISITKDWDKPKEIRERLGINLFFQLFEDYETFITVEEKLSYMVSQIAYKNIKNIPSSLEEYIDMVKQTEEFKQIQKVVNNFYGYSVPIYIDIDRDYETPHSFFRFVNNYYDNDDELWTWEGSWDDDDEDYISYYSRPENGNLFDKENEELLERLIFDNKSKIQFFFNG